MTVLSRSPLAPAPLSRSYYRRPRWFFLSPTGEIEIVGGADFAEAKRSLRRLTKDDHRKHYDYRPIGLLES